MGSTSRACGAEDSSGLLGSRVRVGARTGVRSLLVCGGDREDSTQGLGDARGLAREGTLYQASRGEALDLRVPESPVDAHQPL